MKYLEDFGAVGNGITDDSVAIQAALDAGGLIVAASKTYKCDSTLNLNTQGTIFKGETLRSTILSASQGAAVSINCTQAEIHCLNITRDGQPVTNKQLGLYAGFNTLHSFTNLVLSNHFDGMFLASASYALVQDCYIHRNFRNGITITNSAASSAMQWTLKHLLLELNDGHGLFVTPSPLSPSALCPIGDWDNINTFANSGYGIYVQGSPQFGVEGIRLRDSFIGADGLGGIYIDSFAHVPHSISNCYIEDIGLSNTGRAFSKPPTNSGAGIHLSANNPHASLTNNKIINIAGDGIRIGAAKVLITNNYIYLASYKNIPGTAGLNVIAGTANISSNTITNCLRYGISLNTAGHLVTGNDCRGNRLNGYVGQLTSSALMGNL